MSRYLGQGDGSDGVVALGSYTQTWYSCSGTASASTLSVTGTFSAGDRVFIIQSRGTGVGSYEDNRVASYVAGTLTLVHPLENTYTDSGASQAQIAVVKEASSVTGSFTVSAWDGNTKGVFVMACSGVFSGVVNGSGKGYRGGAGAWDTAFKGEGHLAASLLATNTSANGNGGGAGIHGAFNSGNLEIGGAGGGHAATGESNSEGQTPISGGSAVGSASLTSLYLGGGGGGGAGQTNSSGQNVGGAGGAGGAIIVVYANNFSSSASLISNGSNGVTGTGPGGGEKAGGGGGAGGSILIRSTSASISASVTALGGSGANSVSGLGGDGSVGRIRIEACSITGSTNPSASTSIGGHNWCGILGGMI